jgi:hypothetical protein
MHEATRSTSCILVFFKELAIVAAYIFYAKNCHIYLYSS